MHRLEMLQVNQSKNAVDIRSNPQILGNEAFHRPRALISLMSVSHMSARKCLPLCGRGKTTALTTDGIHIHLNTNIFIS